MSTAVSDTLRVLDIVSALQAGELAYADALMATMGAEQCARTAVGVIDLIMTLVADQSGMSNADAMAHMRQWFELRLP